MPCCNTNLHVFHTGCIKQWLAKEFKCPLCKDVITVYNCLELKNNFDNKYPVAEPLADVRDVSMNLMN